MKISALAALGAVSGVLGGCSNGPTGSLSTVADSTGKLVVSPALQTRSAGDTVRFATVRDSSLTSVGDSGPVIWMVSDSRVATLEQQGAWWAVARALHVGTTTITAAHGARAASAVLIVSGMHLVITAQPSTAVAGVPFAAPVVVTIADTAGQPIAGADYFVTVALDSNPNQATFAGSLAATAMNGVATLSPLSVLKAGGPYTFTASANGYLWARSEPFIVTVKPGGP